MYKLQIAEKKSNYKYSNDILNNNNNNNNNKKKVITTKIKT
jgi:hypothetical protein